MDSYNQTNPEFSRKTNEPNFMDMQPISAEEFAKNPDEHTIANEMLLHSIKKEERRQQFNEIINRHSWSNYSNFMKIVNNSIKE